MSVYKTYLNGSNQLFALLIDPEFHTSESLKTTIKEAEIAEVDLIFVGGSLVSQSLESTLTQIGSLTDIPRIIFPGNLMQLSDNAEGILYLSLISGRNPDLLIGNHVLSSQYLKKSGLEVIPTGYILVESGKTTSVEYISNTRPIPANKIDIIVSTALAGQMLGMKLIYLEAGSGAENAINTRIIKEVSKAINIPLMVGGGIYTKEHIKSFYKAGANIVVVGTAAEDNPGIITELTSARKI